MPQKKKYIYIKTAENVILEKNLTSNLEVLFLL